MGYFDVINGKREFIGKIEEGSVVLSPDKVKYLNNKKNKQNTRGFVMFGLDFLGEDIKRLSEAESKFILRIVEHVQYNSCLIMFDKYHPIRTIDQFVKKIDMSNKPVTRILKKFIKANIIFKLKQDGNTHYYINPNVYFYGNDMNNTMNYIRGLFENNVSFDIHTSDFSCT